MPKTTANDKFEYYLEDLDCKWCLYYLGKSRFRRNGCKRDICGFADEKLDALAHRFIKRLPITPCRG